MNLNPISAIKNIFGSQTTVANIATVAGVASGNPQLASIAAPVIQQVVSTAGTSSLPVVGAVNTIPTASTSIQGLVQQVSSLQSQMNTIANQLQVLSQELQSLANQL